MNRAFRFGMVIALSAFEELKKMLREKCILEECYILNT